MGVLRSGSENVDWTDGGDESSWGSARARAIDAVRALVGTEGIRQEYRMHVGEVPVMVWPGTGADGELDLSGVDAALPQDPDNWTALW